MFHIFLCLHRDKYYFLLFSNCYKKKMLWILYYQCWWSGFNTSSFSFNKQKVSISISNILGVRINMESLFFVNSKDSRGSFPTSADPWLKFLVGIPEDLKFQLKDPYGSIFIIILHFSNFSIDLLISLCYFII
jgi:hypothetical protein